MWGSYIDATCDRCGKMHSRSTEIPDVKITTGEYRDVYLCKECKKLLDDFVSNKLLILTNEH